MTISRQTSTKPATPKQLGLLSRLCQERGVTYTKPRDRADASQQINTLLGMKRSSSFERIEDRRAIRTGFNRWGGATAVRADELDGYGSTTRWAPPDLDTEAVLIAIESGHSKCGAIAKAADLDVRTTAAVLGRLTERGEVTRSSKGAYRLADVRDLAG